MDRSPRTPAQQKTAKALFEALQKADVRKPTIELAYDLMTRLYEQGFYIEDMAVDEKLAAATLSSKLVH